MRKIYYLLTLTLLAFSPNRTFDSTTSTLPFSQNWTTTTLITANDNWTGVTSIQGFLGDDAAGGTAVDPQTVVADYTTQDVIANQTNPNTLTSGGVSEFDAIADPTIALQGSGTADFPSIIIYLNTSGFQNITVAYNLRDIDGAADNSIQPVALQYRVGSTGNFTNVPAGFVADASSGPSLATLVTPVSAVLPAACDNQSQVQVRVITSNAVGSDEWIGIDDINITGTPSASPNITVTPSSLSGFSAVTGIPSAEQSYTVSGANLTNDIVITPPVGFEISTTSGSGFIVNPATITLTQSGGTVNNTTIFARMNSVTLGTNTGDIANASTGATTRNVSLNGKVLAAEPGTQGVITFGTITTSSIVVNFTSGNGAKRILLAKSTTAVDSDPVDGTTYTANAAFGSGTQIGTGNYVVYAGTGNTETVTGLAAGVTYHFAVYEYNDGGIANAENYLTTAPGTGNATTDATVTTYTWTNGGADNIWTNSANWSPVRTTPATTDILQFNDAATYTITGVTTQTVRQLLLSNNTVINLQSGAAATLTVNGGTGTDLDITAGSQLNFSGTSALQLSLLTGATGSVAGAMSFTNGAHRLLSPDASGITFNSGAVFTEGAASSGNPFGTSNLSSVVFANGSTFVQAGGSNPFAAAQPTSVVVFQTGSLFKLQASLTPSFSGRTYANFELDFAAANISGSGSNTLSIDNLTVTQGILNLGMTGTFNLKGNISVATGATLNFNPASAATLTLNGVSAQSISNSGTLTFGTNQSVTVNNSNGITLNANVALGTAGTLTLTSGNVTLGNNNLSATTVSGGSSANHIKTNGTGLLTINNIAVAAKTFPVGNATYNPVIIENGSGHDWSVRATDTITADPGFNTTKAVLKSWIITPSVNPPAGGADITFEFNEATQVGGTFSTATNVQAWRRPNGSWIRSGSPAAVNTTVPNAAIVKLIGLTAFSQYGLSNIDGPLPVNFGAIKATQVTNGIKVDWNNLTETEVVNYRIERSADGRNFVSIGEVNARLNNGGKADYSFIDATPFSGVNFYRIRSLETTGKLKYSIIVKVDIRGGATQLVLYPNPSTGGQLSYQANNLLKGQYTIRIFNSAGQQVYSKALNHQGGSVTEAIVLPVMQPGIYSLQLISDDNNFTKTFVVQ